MVAVRFSNIGPRYVVLIESCGFCYRKARLTRSKKWAQANGSSGYWFGIIFTETVVSEYAIRLVIAPCGTELEYKFTTDYPYSRYQRWGCRTFPRLYGCVGKVILLSLVAIIAVVIYNWVVWLVIDMTASWQSQAPLGVTGISNHGLGAAIWWRYVGSNVESIDFPLQEGRIGEKAEITFLHPIYNSKRYVIYM